MRVLSLALLSSLLSLPALSVGPSAKTPVPSLRPPSKAAPVLLESSEMTAALRIFEQAVTFYVDQERNAAIAQIQKFASDSNSYIPANSPKGFAKSDAAAIGNQLTNMVEKAKKDAIARLAKLKAMKTTTDSDFKSAWQDIYGGVSLMSKNVKNQSNQFLDEVKRQVAIAAPKGKK
jgi:hypothetical protein